MKYKVGDKVRFISDICPRGNIPKGYIMTITYVDKEESPWLFCTGENTEKEQELGIDISWGWYKIEEHMFELVEEDVPLTATEVLNSYCNLNGTYTVSIDNGVLSNGCVVTLPDMEIYQSKNLSIKKQSIMSKLTTFVKNSLLSADEKALRQVGLKTDCGEYTQEAIDLLLQEMCAEKEARLIEVANGLLAEDKKNK